MLWLKTNHHTTAGQHLVLVTASARSLVVKLLGTELALITGILRMVPAVVAIVWHLYNSNTVGHFGLCAAWPSFDRQPHG